MSSKFYLMFAILFGFAFNTFAQTYPEISIKDIQYIGPDSLNTYFVDDVAGPYTGDTVTVTGVVMVPPYKGASAANGTLIYIGTTLAGFYLQDTSETDWSSILVMISNPSNYPAFQSLDSGAVVKVTGVVTHYANATQKTTELALIGFDGSEVIDFVQRPKPVVLTLDSLKEIGTSASKAISEKWEGVYIEIQNVRTFDRTSSGAFKIIDDNGTIASIYTRSNNLYNSTPPADNTVLEYIRGYIETRSEDAGGASINPMYLDEIKAAQFPPSITEITRNPVIVPYNQSVTVSAKIKDPDGSVVNAKLYWRKNSETNNEVVMTATSDSTFEAVIPAQSDSCLVDYFITSEDNVGNKSVTPSDTTKSRYFYLVLDRALTIQDVEYSPFGSGYSGYNNYDVTVRGIVTADTSDIPIGPQVIIQNGTGPWSAIRINGTQTLLLKKGDDVTVTGTVIENYSVTNITGINNASAITVNSTGNALPEPEALSTEDIGTKTGGTVSAEQWENVLIKYSNVIVTDENADGNAGPNVSGSNSNFGEILVADGSNVSTRVELQDGNNSYHNFDAAEFENVPTRVIAGNTFTELVGILYYSFSNYKLIPRTDADFVGYATDVDEKSNNTPYDYKLAQNYPNPFNPSTRISYSIKEEGLVTLKIFNILGQEVATLVNDVKSPGNYNVNFDASRLSSGIYLYKINSNGFTQTKKMMLLK